MAREPVSGICIQLTDAKMTRNDMRSLHDHFKGVPDVRRVKGCKHGIVNALALATGVTLRASEKKRHFRGVGTNVGGVTNCSCL